MKQLPQKMTCEPRANRRGSTLLIVIALLGLLSLLGFVFYTFAAQERQNANYFAEGAMGDAGTGLDWDTLMDWGLRQLTVGPPNDRVHSALWGGRHSLVYNMLGRDIHPFNGEGVNVYADPDTGEIVVDQDFNVGTPPNGFEAGLLGFNDSPAATGSLAVSNLRLQNAPEPDVDYTYPDINNVFLGYRGFAFDSGASEDLIIPSFHRPQYLREDTGAPTWEPIDDWATNPATAQRVMRPHPEHVIPGTGGVKRFLNAADPTDLAIITDPLLFPGGSGGFPFNLDDPANGGDGDGRMEMGYYSWAAGFTDTDHEYDTDNDGDGKKEGVWMDLDFPPQTQGGITFVPLFSFTVYDLDALINLNIAGNLFGDIDLAGVPFGGGEFVSRSNEGLGPSEISPLWALDAHQWGPDETMGTADDPDFVQHRYFFRPAAPSTWTPNDRMELANMEWWRLNMGHLQLDAPAPSIPTTIEITPGRYGELQRQYVATTTTMDPFEFPLPGVSVNSTTGDPVDDDNDRNEGERVGGRRPFGHPRDFRGVGRFWLSGNPKAPQLTALSTGNPARALQYENYSTQGTVPWAFGPDGAPGEAGVDDDGNGITDFLPNGQPDLQEVFYPATDDFVLMNGYTTDSLINHPLEITVEPRQARRPWDEIFGAQSVPFLHMSTSDLNNSTEPPETRLGKLAPVNFGDDEIRRRFTTLSFDRKQFGMPRIPGFRDWEWNADSNDNAPPFVPGNPPENGHEFPPQFSTPSFTVTPFGEDLNGNGVQDSFEPDVNGNGSFDPTLDPFRAQLRRLLQMEIGGTEFAQQFPLSINHVLDVERVAGATANIRTGPLVFRPLTPHPDDPATLPGSAVTTIPPANPLPPYPPTNVREQEFWARRDRQMLARDIYVLLYTLCGRDGTDTNNPTNDSGFYTSNEPERFAQFAVNLVDAMDRDNVITKFEYDTDLTNGWNLDDDPYTDSDGGSDRAVVYGVEAQTLTLSEGIGVISAKTDTVNHAYTMYNDTDDPGRSFLYVELRNMHAQPVRLSTSLSNASESAIWRIRRDDNNDGTINGNDEAVTFLSAINTALAQGPIDAGGLFSIGSSDGRDQTGGFHRPSDFRVDYDLDGTHNLIIPNVPDYATVPDETTLPTDPNLQPKLNLDLVHARDDGTWELTINSTTKGKWAESLTSGGNVTFVLERRLHQGLPHLDDTTANPWIEVDRMTVPVQDFVIDDSTTAAIQLHNPATISDDALDPLRSRERDEPLNRNSNALYDTTVGDGLHYTSLHGDGATTLTNSQTTDPFTLWQPHFDRDFASVIDLLAIPLYGPHETTEDFSASRAAPVNQAADPKVAGALFLNPMGDVGNPNDNNRWHRLLSFVGVPTRTHRELGNPLENSRVPGQINLNTLRQAEVLAGLLDDRQVIARDYTNPGVYLPDQSGSGGAARDWYAQLLRARDGVPGLSGTSVTSVPDPVSGLYLPGVAGSKPFRSLAFSAQRDSSIEYTLLRSLPLDDNSLDPSADKRQLFELGTFGEHQTTGSNPDHYMRHRMLSKIANNVTTRSNTFVVFITVGFFEADMSSGVARIGGDATATVSETGAPYRGVFVVDRSDLEEAFDQQTGQIDWRKLVKHRLRIQ